MAPKGFWRRPLTQMYNRNYQYGTGLYSGTLEDIEKRYSNSVSRTRLPSDRLDTGFSSFRSSILGVGLNAPVDTSTSAIRGRSPRVDFDASSSNRHHAFHNRASEPDSYDLRRARSFGDFDTFRSRSVADEFPTSYLHSVPPSSYHRGYDTEEEADPSKAHRRRRRKHQELASLERNLADTLNTLTLHEPVSNLTTSSSQWTDRCRELETQVEQLTQRVKDAETRVHTDVKEMKNKMQIEITEVGMLLDEAMKHNEEQQKVIKKQAKRLAELESHYDEVNRHLQEANELLASSQRKCQTLQVEVNNLKRGMDYHANVKSSSKFP